ncbi:DUF4307 domain-containing protein [uncultured Corynebacterium sp.]|uniref:DUF4307 domain-containing protein n=1 Tax=uncultured Corynebacterium sp. TaxID=159447 RepID=UPI0025E868E7|nr:DUF4307 domain-containing protein [uncultured Corynebacterium sp.]
MSNNSNSPSNASGASEIPGATERPASRYRGDRETMATNNWTGKVIAALAVVIVVALVIAFVQFMQRSETQTVTGTMGAFERIDDHTFQMDVDITRDNPEEPTYCIVTALAYSHAEVGRREILVEPSTETVVRVTTQIPTREPAVSGGVYGCSTTIPSHMNL